MLKKYKKNIWKFHMKIFDFFNIFENSTFFRIFFSMSIFFGVEIFFQYHDRFDAENCSLSIYECFRAILTLRHRFREPFLSNDKKHIFTLTFDLKNISRKKHTEPASWMGVHNVSKKIYYDENCLKLITFYS